MTYKTVINNWTDIFFFHVIRSCLCPRYVFYDKKTIKRLNSHFKKQKRKSEILETKVWWLYEL